MKLSEALLEQTAKSIVYDFEQCMVATAAEELVSRIVAAHIVLLESLGIGVTPKNSNG